MRLRDFTVTVQIPSASEAIDQVIFIAPFNLEVVSIQANFRVTSTSGTMGLKKAANGTAIGSGTEMLSAAMYLSGTAANNVTGAFLSTAGIRNVLKGSAIGLDFGGTVTNLVAMNVTLILRQTGLAS